MRVRLLLPLLAALGIALAQPAAALVVTSDSPDQPHLLLCTVVNTVKLNEDGLLVPDNPKVPGARALGRISTFVVDPPTGLVRLPGLGDIDWTLARGGGENNPDWTELVLTPTTQVYSATTVSIHIFRKPNVTWFVFFEVDTTMSGTCDLIQSPPTP